MISLQCGKFNIAYNKFMPSWLSSVPVSPIFVECNAPVIGAKILEHEAHRCVHDGDFVQITIHGHISHVTNKEADLYYWEHGQDPVDITYHIATYPE